MNEKGAWIVGEALIDLVPDADGKRRAIVGGGPANTAKALAKLGINSNFIGGISSDSYGRQIEEELLRNGVDISLSLQSELPTATAKVTLNESGSATYEFSLDGTATFDFRSSWLPQGTPAALHLGTLGTLIEPGASDLYTWAESIKVPKIYDPNIRPTVMGDREKYSAIFEKWVALAEVVKMSEEDWRWLYGANRHPRELLNYGPAVVILTRGEHGLSGMYKSKTIDVSGKKVAVVDTVGAGDTVGAILLEAISQEGVSGLIENLEKVLERAAKAAAITCSRAGAQPPTKVEIEEF
ncbi:MAG: carbohydrate kinase [Candidatus Nanopelagicaceae bacterium]|nr:carbohydrate kinase [Candidatus Nanopelagicaceae bacterium]